MRTFVTLRAYKSSAFCASPSTTGGGIERREHMRSTTTFAKGHTKVGGFTKGDKHSEQSRKKISRSLYGKRGKLSRRWAGDLAGYAAIHAWISKVAGKASRCDNKNCLGLPASRFEWASISGECKRDEGDFVELCTRCHRKYDNGNSEIITSKGTFRREKSVTCPKCNHKIIL